MKRLRSGIILLSSAVLLSMTACDSGKPETQGKMAKRLQSEQEKTEDVSQSAIFGNLTPELMGLSKRPVDFYSDFALSTNTNLREFWDDWDRAWLIDRPSRLSPKPIPHSSSI